VVHYANTALPGQIGNNVIVGHSSNNFFNGGKYKFAFVLLDRLQIGDTFMLNYEGTRYVYRVFNRKVVEPTDFSLIQPTDKPVATLITCDPPGTSWQRLIIQGEQISPDPNTATEVQEQAVDPKATVVPGNAPSLWDSIRDFIF
jgi:sortase A